MDTESSGEEGEQRLCLGHGGVGAGAGVGGCGLRDPPAETTLALLAALPALTRGRRRHPLPLLPGGRQESRPGGSAHSPGPRGTMGHLPPAATLDLSAPRPSAELPEEWPSTEEIRRFWTLRQEIVGLEQAKILTNQLLAEELPPNLREALHTQKAPRPVLPRVLRYAGQAPDSPSAELVSLCEPPVKLLAPRCRH